VVGLDEPKLPQLGCGSGHTTWRRLRAWQAAGVWERLHQLVLDELSEADLLDWSRANIDAVSVRARGGELTVPNPVDRSKPGSRFHLLVDATGLPLMSCSQRPTPTTARWSNRCWRPPQVSVAVATNPVDRDAGPRSCTPTRATTIQLPALPTPPRDQGPDRPARCRGQDQTRVPPLGRGAHRVLAAALQAPRPALRSHRSHASATAAASGLDHQPPAAHHHH
jgi:hypothetical protein